MPSMPVKTENDLFSSLSEGNRVSILEPGMGQGDRFFKVASQSKDRMYDVTRKENCLTQGLCGCN
jgi:hypothetical protein